MRTLAQYLAEYLATEGDKYNTKIGTKAIELMKKWIEEGMKAYMSVEDCEIIISAKDQIENNW